MYFRFFSRHVQFDSGFHVMTLNEISWDRPKITCGFTMSLVVRLKKTRLILREDYLILLLCLGCPGLRWMFSEPDLFQKVWLFHLRLGIWKCPPFWCVNTSFALSLRAWSSDASSPPILCLQPSCLLSMFFPRTAHVQEIYLARLWDRIDAVSTGLEQR